MSKQLSYADAGVSIDAGNAFVARIRKAAASTYRKEVLAGIGGFGALFSARFPEIKDPVLVASTDGVGTKILLHERFGTHRWAGQDLVAMCVNDLATQGAMPLFFLDYIACGKLDLEPLALLVEGIAEACRSCECALIGGETAEMPGMYEGKRYDVAGFAVGVADQANIVDGSSIRKGDVLIGVASNGVHANGFSLVRRILEQKKLDLSKARLSDGTPAWQALLAPTRLYVPLVRAWQQAGIGLKGLAHITGGGLYENLARVLPEGVGARIDPHAWQVPEVFSWLFSLADVPMRERYRVFNMGVGFVAVVDEAQLQKALSVADQEGERAWPIGMIVPSEAEKVLIEGVE